MRCWYCELYVSQPKKPKNTKNENESFSVIMLSRTDAYYTYLYVSRDAKTFK